MKNSPFSTNVPLLILLFLTISIEAGNAEFKGEGIQIKKTFEGTLTTIKKGEITAEKKFKVSGTDIELKVREDDSYEISTNRAVLFRELLSHIDVKASGMQYSSRSDEGEAYGPVKAETAKGIIETSGNVMLFKGILKSAGSFIYTSKDGKMDLCGDAFEYDGTVLFVKGDYELRTEGYKFTGTDAEYREKEGMVIFPAECHLEGKDLSADFNKGRYDTAGKHLSVKGPVLRERALLKGREAELFFKNGALDRYSITGEPSLCNESYALNCDKIKSTGGKIDFLGQPRIEVYRDTSTLTLFPKRIFYDSDIRTLTATEGITGHDNTGNIYFARDFAIDEKSRFLITGNFYMFNEDYLVSSRSVEGDSRSLHLYDDGYLYYDRDGTEMFFEEAFVPDTSINEIFFPSVSLRSEGSAAKARDVEACFTAGRKQASGRYLTYYSPGESVFLRTDEFRILDDIIIFPAEAELFVLEKNASFTDTSPASISQRVKASKGFYDSKRKMMTGENIITEHDGWNIKGRSVTFSGTDKIFLSAAQITDCDLEHPHYFFSVNKLKIIRNDKLIFKDAFLHIGGLPILYLPFYIKDINPENGPLVTYIGRDSYLGFFIKNKVLIRPKLKGLQLKVNLLFDIMSEADLGGGISVKYKLPGRGSGNLLLYYNRDWDDFFIRKSPYRDIQKIDGSFNQNLFGIKLTGQIQRSNYDEMYRFFENESVINRRDYMSQIYASLDHKKLFYVSIGSRQTVYRFNTYESRTLVSPDLRFNLKNQDLKFLKFSSGLTFRRAETTDSGSFNLSLMPSSVRAPFFTVNMNVTPTANFTFSTVNGDPEYFLYLPVAVAFGSSMYRVFEMKGMKIKHVFSPSISFSYAHSFNTANTANLLSPGSLSCFSSPKRSLNFVLNNTFTYKKEERTGNYANIRINFPYDFAIGKIPSAGISASVYPIKLNMIASCDLTAGRITAFTADHSGHITKDLYYSTRLNYYEQFTQTFSLGWQKKLLTLKGNLSYNYYGEFGARFTKKEVELLMNLHCFIIKASYQNHSTGGTDSLNKFLFSVAIGKLKESDMKIETDLINDVINVMGVKEPLPM